MNSNFFFQGKVKMLHVTLVKHQDTGDLTFRDGFIESTSGGDHWHWDFYETHKWDQQNESPKSGFIPTRRFEKEEIDRNMLREDNTVRFHIAAGGTDFVGSYSLIFVDENDAKHFIGETHANTVNEFSYEYIPTYL